MSRIDTYRDLVVWQRGIDLVEKVYLLTRSYPRDEQFGLTSQSRRAAVSVPANIAEGYGRGTPAAYSGFLRIARGSLRELETHLIIADRVRVASASEISTILAECDHIGRMLHGLITKVSVADRPS